MCKRNASLELLEATMCQLAFHQEPWSIGRLMHWRKAVCPCPFSGFGIVM
jgi:hypothetical protein